jgi:hypothetical protein
MFVSCLPDALLSEIFSEWIELKDLTRFDSSVTNHDFRHNVLEIIKSQQITFHNKDAFEQNRSMHWISLRKINLSVFYFQSLNVEQNSSFFHSLNVSKIKKIAFSEDNVTVTSSVISMINKCTNLTSLDLTNFAYYLGDDDQNIWLLLDKKIQSKLTELLCVSSDESRYFETHCKSLVKFSTYCIYYEEDRDKTLQMFGPLLKNNPQLKSIMFDSLLLKDDKEFHARVKCFCKDATISFLDSFWY